LEVEVWYCGVVVDVRFILAYSSSQMLYIFYYMVRESVKHEG